MERIIETDEENAKLMERNALNARGKITSLVDVGQPKQQRYQSSRKVNKKMTQIMALLVDSCLLLPCQEIPLFHHLKMLNVPAQLSDSLCACCHKVA